MTLYFGSRFLLFKKASLEMSQTEAHESKDPETHKMHTSSASLINLLKMSY